MDIAEVPENTAGSDGCIPAKLPSGESEGIRDLRRLAGEGRLAIVAGAASPSSWTALCGAAFAIAWPVVFARLTRGIEIRRGHAACAASVFRMSEDCLDRFYEDVEAVLDDLLAHARMPIRDIEAWMAARLNASTVNGHRRRRGRIGALQRPRMPIWLSEALHHDPWLIELATQILLWVGVRATAGTELWPLDAWTVRRTVATGDCAGSTPATVAREIDAVLVAMRSRPMWYQDYVERPFGHKYPPVLGAQDQAESRPLLLTDRADADDADLMTRATAALQAIEARLSRGQDVTMAILEVIGTLFGVDARGHDIEHPPLISSDYGEHVSALLRDTTHVERMVNAVSRIVSGLATPAARSSLRRGFPVPRAES